MPDCPLTFCHLIPAWLSCEEEMPFCAATLLYGTGKGFSLLNQKISMEVKAICVKTLYLSKKSSFLQLAPFPLLELCYPRFLYQPQTRPQERC